jgi:hypothetical protein
MKRGPPPKEKGDSHYMVMKRTQVTVGDVVMVLEAPKRLSKKRGKRDKGTIGRQKPFSAINHGGRTLSNEAHEYVDYVVEFHPPMPLEDARSGATLVVTYVGTKESKGRITLPLCPPGVPVYSHIIVPKSLEYVVYPTHALKTEEDGTLASKMYFRAENNLLYGGGTLRIQMEPAIDMGSLFLEPEFGSERFKGLHFFPVDVDPAEHALTIDPRNIPQRTPLWFKLRSEVSGSRAYKLMGYFPGEREFTLFDRCTMRFGSLSEDISVIGYLTRWPSRRFEEVGTCSAPPDGYPANWGASPDGRVCDPDMTWGAVPEKFRKHYTNGRFDVTKGAIEIKSSRRKKGMEDYFYPQVYMEMIALDVMWCDLVRYCRSRYKDSDGKWVYKHSFRVHRIYRHEPTEALLVKCLQHAANAVGRGAKLKDIVREKGFVALRELFSGLSKTASYDTIEMTPELQERLDKYNTMRRMVAWKGLAPPPSSTDEDDDDGGGGAGLGRMWADMEGRAETMRDLFQDAASSGGRVENNNRAEFVHLASLQIQDWAALINMVVE